MAREDKPINPPIIEPKQKATGSAKAGAVAGNMFYNMPAGVSPTYDWFRATGVQNKTGTVYNPSWWLPIGTPTTNQQQTQTQTQQTAAQRNAQSRWGQFLATTPYKELVYDENGNIVYDENGLPVYSYKQLSDIDVHDNLWRLILASSGGNPTPAQLQQYGFVYDPSTGGWTYPGYVGVAAGVNNRTPSYGGWGWGGWGGGGGGSFANAYSRWYQTLINWNR